MKTQPRNSKRYTYQRIPNHVIKPLEELLRTVLIKILSSPPIEVRVEFMNDGPVLINGLQANVVRVLEEEGRAVENRADPDKRKEVVGWGQRGLGRRHVANPICAIGKEERTSPRLD